MLGFLGVARPMAACLLAIGFAAAAPMPALAHAELVESSPAANASLVEAPGTLALTFSEPIDPTSAVVELLDDQQRAVEGLGDLRISDDARSVSATLARVPPGVYTVSYQVVSTVDGHATAGIFAFLVDPSGAAPPPTDSATSSSPSVDPLTVAARWLALAMMLVALGSLVVWWGAGRAVLAERFAAETGPPWWLVGAASGLASVGIAAYLLLSARPIAGSGAGTGIPLDIAGPFGWTPFAVAMRISFVAGLLAVATSLRSAIAGRAPRSAAAAVAAILAVGLGGMSVAGHAASSGGPAFAAIDWLHLVAVAAWVGALPGALLLGTRARGSLTAILRGHGRVALVAAPVVALTGIANSPLVLGDVRNLVASDYGNLLVAKASLLSVAVGIGAVNHLVLRGRGRAAVAALVAAELVVAAVAVSAAATMVTIQPASARQPELATTPVNPSHLFGVVGPSRVHVSVSVPAPGDQAYRVILSDVETGAPREDVQKVFLELTPPDGAGLPTERVELVREGDPRAGLWVTNGAFTPVLGEWELAVVVRRAGERDESVAFELPVTAPGTPELGPPPDTGIGVPAPLAAVWSFLPPGLLGWVPAIVALLLVAVLGRLPSSTARAASRGAAVAVLVIATAAAGSRSLVVAANAPSDEELARQPVVVEAADVERGEAVYRANCSSCHGIEADGEGPVTTQPDAGPLATAVAGASDAELSYRIAYGIAGTPMPAFAGVLTPEERADLIAYLRQQTR